MHRQLYKPFHDNGNTFEIMFSQSSNLLSLKQMFLRIELPFYRLYEANVINMIITVFSMFLNFYCKSNFKKSSILLHKYANHVSLCLCTKELWDDFSVSKSPMSCASACEDESCMHRGWRMWGKVSTRISKCIEAEIHSLYVCARNYTYAAGGLREHRNVNRDYLSIASMRRGGSFCLLKDDTGEGGKISRDAFA